MNKIFLAGRLGQDPEIRATENSNVATVSLATNDYWGGEQQTTWHNLVLFGKQAEAFARLAAKGTLVAVVGSQVHRKYEDKEGNMRYFSEVRVSDFDLLSDFGEGRKDAPAGNRGARAAANPFATA